MRILIADDDAEIRSLLRAQLATFSESIIEAKHTIELLDRLLGMAFDLVITDVRMPHGNVFDVAKRIRKMGNLVPIIFITAFSDDTVVKQIKSLERTIVLFKPYEEDHLITTAQLITVGHAFRSISPP